MSVSSGPSAISSGLVLALDASNLKSFGPPTVEALVVAGGGGGGGWGGGGGGGGLLYSDSLPVTAGTAYTVTVGLGGIAGTTAYSVGGNGGNSVLGSLTAVGGGGGGCWSASAAGNGGSGGGGSGIGSFGTGTAGQGFAGGAAPGTTQSAPYLGHGGGGGAGAAGQGGMTGVTGGVGGIGRQFSISGTDTWYAGGGGGHSPGESSTAVAAGGRGGGGAGGNYYNPLPAYSGTANTGGGGGGNYGDASRPCGAGGTGIVIIRYAGAQKATGGTITSLGGYTIHTFTASGTFTIGANWGDTSGNNFTGALINGPTYNSANGGSLVFNGSSTYVNIPYNSNFDFPGDFAICVWLYPTAYALTYQTIIDTYPGGAQNGWIFTTMNGGTNAISWYTQGCNWCQSSAAVDLNAWNFLVATRIGTTTKVYKNAVEILSVTDTLNITGGELNIGRGLDDSYGRINGRISNVAIYKGKGFLPSEVQQTFNALRSRFGI